MRLRLLAVGKLKRGPERELVARYAERLPWKLDWVELSDGMGEGQARRDAEGKQLLTRIPEEAYLIALDERGKDLTSIEFAQFMSAREYEGRPLIFLIGGAYGLSEAIRARANLLLGLGAMTWPHQLVRVLLLEQLYRAASLNAGHPYHKI